MEEVGCAQPLPVEQLDRSGSRLLLPRALLHVTTELKAIPILGQENGSETSLRELAVLPTAWRRAWGAAASLLIEDCRGTLRVGAQGREGALLVCSVSAPASCRGGMSEAQLMVRVRGERCERAPWLVGAGGRG